MRRFSWRELQLATKNFSEGNIIGQGGFGKVYKGVLSDNTKVAVKRLVDYHNPGGEAAFEREVLLISVAVHRNLLRLIGFCTTSTERILVYPFMENLSVAYRLRGKTRLLILTFDLGACQNVSEHNVYILFYYSLVQFKRVCKVEEISLVSCFLFNTISLWCLRFKTRRERLGLGNKKACGFWHSPWFGVST